MAGIARGARFQDRIAETPWRILPRTLCVSLFFSSKLIRLNRIWILPQTTPRGARFIFGFGVERAVFWRLLVFVELVVPRQAGFDLFEVDVLAVEQNFSNQSPVLIGLVANRRYIFVEEHVRQVLLGLSSERLMRFRGVDALQPNPMLRVCRVEIGRASCRVRLWCNVVCR